MELKQKNEEEDCIPDKKSGKFDHLTEIIGIFGPFHMIINTTLALSVIIHNWQMFSNKFYTYEPNFWCARPENQIDLSGSNWLNLSSPLKSVDDKYEFDKCLQFDIDYIEHLTITWFNIQPLCISIVKLLNSSVMEFST